MLSVRQKIYTQHALPSCVACDSLSLVTETPDYVGNAEACEILGGLDRSTLVRWVQLGKLHPAQKLPGPNGAYLFRRRDVEALRDARAKAPDENGAVA